MATGYPGVYNGADSTRTQRPEEIGVSKRETLGDALAKLEAAVGYTHRSVTELGSITQPSRTPAPAGGLKELITVGNEDVNIHLLSRINDITASVLSANSRIECITNEFDI